MTAFQSGRQGGSPSVRAFVVANHALASATDVTVEVFRRSGPADTLPSVGKQGFHRRLRGREFAVRRDLAAEPGALLAGQGLGVFDDLGGEAGRRKSAVEHRQGFAVA